MSKVIFFCASLQGGGAERVLSVLSNRLADHYDSVDYLMLYNAPIFYVIDERVKVISIEEETGSKNIVINMFWFRKYINKQKPNLILSFSAPFNMLALSSLLWTKHKVVACERVDPKSFRWGKPLEFIRNLLYERADGILTQTQMSKDYFVGDLLKKTDIIYNPIEMSKEYLGAALSINFSSAQN